MSKVCKQEFFYGTTTLGEKGQVVIPADAREALHLKKGEKLLVFSIGNDMLAFSKVAHLEKFASKLAKRLELVRGAIKKIS